MSLTKHSGHPRGRKLIRKREVRRRLGDVSESTLRRMRKDEQLNFPQPRKILGTDYWGDSEIDDLVERVLAEGE